MVFGKDHVNFAGIDCDWCQPDIMRFLKQETNLSWCGFYLPVRDDNNNLMVSAAAAWHNKRSIMKSLGWGLAPIYIGKQHDGRKLRALMNQRLKDAELQAALKAEGVKDGKEAIKGALDEGFQPPTVIYFDVEHPWVPHVSVKDAFIEYLKAWCDTLYKARFYAGIYCITGDEAKFPTSSVAKDLHKAIPSAYIWAVNYNHGNKPNGDGGAFAEAQKAKKEGRDPKPVTQKVFDLHPRYPVIHPDTSGYGAASVWQMAGNCMIPVKIMTASNQIASFSPDGKKKSGKNPAPFFGVKVDINTSIFADPGFPFPSVQPSSAPDITAARLG
jgi:hypothetical protein